jgi:hypothetical protein
MCGVPVDRQAVNVVQTPACHCTRARAESGNAGVLVSLKVALCRTIGEACSPTQLTGMLSAVKWTCSPAFFSGWAQALLNGQYGYRQGLVAAKLRAGVTTTVFRKVLAINSATLAQIGTGGLPCLSWASPTCLSYASSSLRPLPLFTLPSLPLPHQQPAAMEPAYAAVLLCWCVERARSTANQSAGRVQLPTRFRPTTLHPPDASRQASQQRPPSY